MLLHLHIQLLAYLSLKKTTTLGSPSTCCECWLASEKILKRHIYWLVWITVYLLDERRNNNIASFYDICCTSTNLSIHSLICSIEMRKHNITMNHIEKKMQSCVVSREGIIWGVLNDYTLYRDKYLCQDYGCVDSVA